MPDAKVLLEPAAIKRISRLELRARHIVDGYLSGMHRSPYFGQSVEFRQHREYVPGDDLRNVDWKVWAKQDRHYIKQYEEDANLRCTLLVDVSASMNYASGPLSKYEYAASAAAAIAYLLLKQQDAVACVTFADAIRARVQSRTRHSHLDAVVRALAEQSPAEKTSLFEILRDVAEHDPRRGMIVLLSDLFVEREGLFKGLKLLRQRGHDLLVLHVLADDELDFTFTGPTRFEGLETADFLNCNPRALREGYLEALHQYLAEIRRGCAQNAVDYRQVRTSEPLDAALAALLASRANRRRPA
ncbi:MAG: DUF58 domain-containing protein [Planctomycetota bacterium]|nr:MAG: DUF58 domain-containing protein [Planctomycetota bacterium]